MIFEWISKYILRRVAQARGFIDPMKVVAQLQKFAQPSEVAAPIELLRLSSVLQVRGLINAQAIQHNLDWVWPFWVQKQFNPRDAAFIPRAFSMTHINLTHRNWTAVGLPEVRELPVVDPRGAVTPHYDGWSIDCWVYRDKEHFLTPSRMPEVIQELEWDKGLGVVTKSSKTGINLEVRAWVKFAEDGPRLCLEAEGQSAEDAKLVFSLRPMNPEGVSFIHQIEWNAEKNQWLVNKKKGVEAGERPEKVLFSHYREGDVASRLDETQQVRKVKCEIGMATSALLYPLKADEPRVVRLEVPLKEEKEPEMKTPRPKAAEVWNESLKGLAELRCPDSQFQFLYDAALRTLVLHAPGKDVYPGPYTYKHFWFRDAAFIIEAMTTLGMHGKCEEIIDSFGSRQTPFGHFLSQDGEWDSNGEALWMYERFCRVRNTPPKKEWMKAIKKGAKWIVKKRLSSDLQKVHAGLFPAGFSAEHLGPNDFYFWDDFWGVAGLKAAAWLYRKSGEDEEASGLELEAEDFMKCIDRSLLSAEERLGTKAMPSSPYRRLDTGSIGSIACGYPLQLWRGDDPRLTATVDYLLENCMVDNGFFHDMSHSGVNAYLTLEIAQVLLRAGDPRYLILMDSVARAATSTGQWPEAIHPGTKGGCMGDGQHVWAAAEWLLMVRNCFVLEEEDRLVLCAGVPAEWLQKKEDISLGPVYTKFGEVTVRVKFKKGFPDVSWEGNWHASEPVIEVKLPEHV